MRASLPNRKGDRKWRPLRRLVRRGLSLKYIVAFEAWVFRWIAVLADAPLASRARGNPRPNGERRVQSVKHRS